MYDLISIIVCYNYIVIITFIIFLFVLLFVIYSVMVLTTGHTGSRPLSYSEIPKDPLVEYFEKEINALKEQLKTSEEEKMNLQFQIVDAIDENKIKMEATRLDNEMKMEAQRLAYENKLSAMRLKLKKISKYAISQEAWYHYAVGSIITFVAIMIAFVVAFKFL